MRARTTVALVTLACSVAFVVSLRGERLSQLEPGDAETSLSESWPGWRGAAGDGRSTTSLPTRWDGADGILWKTPLPGAGHSSPIVVGDRVFVTSAYLTSSGALLQDTARGLTLALVLVMAALILRGVIQRTQPGRSPGVADLVSGTLGFAAILGLAIMAYGGDGLFDFARCNVRGWIASTVFASLCLALTAASTDDTRRRRVVAAGAVIFAALVLIAFPSKGFAFRGGVSSLRMQISLAAAAVPLVVGTGAVLLSASRRHPANRVVSAVILAVLAVGGVLLVRHLLEFRDDSFPATTYEPRVGIAAISAVIAALVVALAIREFRRASSIANVAVVITAAGAVVCGAVVALEQLAARSPYLAYQIGTPSFETRGGDSIFLVMAAVVLLGVFYRAGHAQQLQSMTHGRSRVAAVALALAVTFFVHVNYLQAQSRMVRAIVAVDRHSGEIAWTVEGLDGPQAPFDGRNSPATPTPVSDGRLICAYFGSPGLMCTDWNGTRIWSRSDLAYEGFYGVGFSPILAEGMLVIAGDAPEGTARVHAVDVATGQTRWTTTFATTPTVTGNNRTPLVRTINGRKLLILWGMQYVKALALESGEQVWSYDLVSDGDLVSSAIADEERLYLSSKAGTIALDLAALAAGRDPVRWSSTARANCVSPVLVNGIVFTITDAGIAVALRATSGEILWRQRLPGHYFASLVASRDAVYFTNSDGLTTVVAAEDTYRLIAKNDLGEPTFASMAASRGKLFARAGDSLYALGLR